MELPAIFHKMEHLHAPLIDTVSIPRFFLRYLDFAMGAVDIPTGLLIIEAVILQT